MPGAQRSETDIDRKLGPIKTAPRQLQRGAHRPGLGRGSEFGPVNPVRMPEPLGYQRLDLSADELIRCVPEHSPDLGVGRHDGSFWAYDDCGVRHNSQEWCECLDRKQGCGVVGRSDPALRSAAQRRHVPNMDGRDRRPWRQRASPQHGDDPAPTIRSAHRIADRIDELGNEECSTPRRRQPSRAPC